MTREELQKAKEGVQREIDTVQRFLLGKMADIAADMGDAELEAGYRWMAERGIWPTEGYSRAQGRSWGWTMDTVPTGTILYSHELPESKMFDHLTISYHENLSLLIEKVAREIGKQKTREQTDETSQA